MRKFRLSFHGGVGVVTGANFLLEPMDGDSPRILVDCGLTQGARFCDDCNRDPFPYDPASMQYLFVTHAHLDHIGRIPFLVKRGFQGVIYSTPATRNLAEIMFDDGLSIMTEEAKREGEEPLYSKEDVVRALALWQTLSYREAHTLEGSCSVRLLDAGHILGSAMVEIIGESGKKIVFTGDLGNVPMPLLQPTDTLENVSYLVMESVYGDRVHERVEERATRLRDVITSTISEKGVLLIPAFSIERTQTLLYEINNLVESGAIPKVPVFLDSPLAIRVTEVYRKHRADFSDTAQEALADGDDIFQFSGLRMTSSVEDSKSINEVPPPKVIIAGAGMSHGGRIQFHEKRYLSDPSTTLLLVGYQVAGSLGRRLQDGAQTVSIMGEEVPVRARMETLSGYSAHCDRDCLVDVVSHTAHSLKRVYVAMGEPKASLSLVQRLRDFLDVDAIAPKKGDTFEIEL